MIPKTHKKNLTGNRSTSTYLQKIVVGSVCVLLLSGFSGNVTAQNNIQEDQTTQHQTDQTDQTDQTPVSPSRAAMLSATLPGLGQIYNQKYWKVPIIYAGFGTLAYFVNFNANEYSKWRDAWVARVDGNPHTVDDFPNHSADVLERAMDYYRRNLEITYILSAGLYLINILDASVDAHLMDFDVGEDLRVSMTPGRIPSAYATGSLQHNAQLTLTIKL
ncbi:MAG: DUF5683 domain-containing protein [Bacteroidales bacterium]